MSKMHSESSVGRGGGGENEWRAELGTSRVGGRRGFLLATLSLEDSVSSIYFFPFVFHRDSGINVINTPPISPRLSAT
jgi:hypothetical protein